MLVLNPKMVEGSPLQYFNPHQTSQFQYFSRFETHGKTEMSRELIRSHSPNSEQSDSDNSLSSVEIFPTVIRYPTTTPQFKNEIRCNWKSCGITFESLDQLSNHVTHDHASSGPAGLFYCGWEGCSRNNKGFNARYKMLVHVRTHTNEKPHRCKQCEKSFSRAENLKIHSRSHSGEKPYICPVPGCSKAYSNSSDRFKHTRTHQVEKPYHCKVPGCPKRYTDPSSLRKHVKTYKHFLSENVSNSDTSKESLKCPSIYFDQTTTSKKEMEDIYANRNVNTYPFTYQNNQSSDNNHHFCSCSHPCCIYNNLDNANPLLKLNTFKNLNTENVEISWNKLLSSKNCLQNNMRKLYETNENPMDLDDTPLDLSTRHHI